MFNIDLLTHDDRHRLRADLRVALIGGGIAAAIMGSVMFSVGGLSSWEARSLLEAALPTVRFLCSSLMTATATTLALMLTLLSLSAGSDRRIKGAHYERIRLVAFVDVVAFVGATLLLALLVVPFSEATDIPVQWYKGIYYGMTLSSALLSGVLVAVMLLLYAAVRDMIDTVGPGDDSPLYVPEDDADAARAEADRSEAAAEEASASAEQAEDAAEDAEEAAREAGA